VKLSDIGSSVGNVIYRQIGRANGHLQTQRSLPVDVLENDHSYLVVFDAPGAEPDDVQVRYLNGTVRIQIDRFRSFHEGYEMRFPGRGMALDGEVELPDNAVVEPDAGTAKLSETGTLDIELPKDSSIDGEPTAGSDETATTDSDESATADSDETTKASTDVDSGPEEVTVDD